MTEKRSIPIALPSLGDEEWHAVREPITSGWLTQGPKVKAFETAFAARHNVSYALATTSCTTALHLALAAWGIGPGDEVILPAFTWIATANAVLYVGARPVFVDVDPHTYNINAASLANAVTERTRAVIPVHLFGLCADMDAVAAAVPDSVLILEDAACAAGAAYKGRAAGGLGHAAAFSFHPRKSITTGEGGMLTSDDEHFAAKAEILRNHGAGVPEEVRHHGPAPYILPDFDELGFNYRMTDLQAAVGVVQLGKLDRFIAERDLLARQYADGLADIPWIQTPIVANEYSPAWQAYVTTVDEDAPLPRNAIMKALQEKGVSTRPGTHAVTTLGYYREQLGVNPDSYPVARRLQNQTMALPLHNRMTEDDCAYVIDAIKSIG